ncbi:AI-2E family transporter [Limnochorda pilosa]|uniref:AI-2E family transporter n=1 Tax=Limnochorda pilosa TaxID=1555112 RepID=A0A0K2SL01_LIMPI|nr:AI-2E family transporter [Limnochorda pilosa]BAS27529.1 hypothetical protein LIP_1683 [Limnochorda pilosa]
MTRSKGWVVAAAGAGVGLLLFYLLLPHLGPLVLGLLLAVLIDRPVTALERRGLGRGVAALAVLAGSALGMAALVGWVGSALFGEVRELAGALPQLRAALERGGSGPAAVAGAWTEALPPLLQGLAQRALESAYGAAGQWVEAAVRALARAPSLVWPLAVATMVAYFASRDRRLLAGAVVAYTPPDLRRRAARLRSRLLLQVAAFLHAQLLLVTLSAILSSLALLALGSPYALSLGLLAGLLDLVPFLGPTAVFGVLAAVRALQGAPVGALAAAAAGLGVFAARQAAEPRVVAGRTQLHPLTVVLAVYLGSRLLGLMGFLLGPVLALAVKALLVEGRR